MSYNAQNLPLTTAAAFHHPFTSIVVGPTQSGKSTWVQRLISNHKTYVDQEFDYIYIFLGTSIEENPILNKIKLQFPDKTDVFQVLNKDEYETKQDVKRKGEYPRYLSQYINQHLPSHSKDKKGCLIFDDLMSEMGDSNIITDLFTKKSSHQNMSIIHITQNLFHKGRSESQNATLYKNTHCLVLFNSPLDSSTVNIVARRMAVEGNAARLRDMMLDVIHKYRCIVIRGSPDTPEILRFTADYFSDFPCIHFKAFTLLPKK